MFSTLYNQTVGRDEESSPRSDRCEQDSVVLRCIDAVQYLLVS